MTIIFADNDARNSMNMYHFFCTGVIYMGSISAELWSAEEALSLLKRWGLSFEESEATANANITHLWEKIFGDRRLVETALGRFFNYRNDVDNDAKAAHFLLAPHEVGKESCTRWIDAYLARHAAGHVMDYWKAFVGIDPIIDIVRAMESVERYSDGVALAEQFKKSYPGVPVIEVEASRAQGRCLTKLGRDSEAESAFEAAIAEAVRVGHTYHELLARRDYIEYVLDPAGRREEQLAALGGTLKALVLEPSEYDGVLGVVSGLDASAAVCASGEGACMTAPTW